MFDERDEGELLLNKSVREFTPEDLLPYSMEMFKHTFGYKMPVAYDKDRAIFRWLVKTYGTDAYALVKWMFYRYHGETNGEVFAVTWFASGHKWWIDQELAKMKKATGQIKPVIRKKRNVGFMSISDMLAAG